MSNNKFEQIINKAKSINLSKEESSVVKNSLLNFIHQNPVKPDSEPLPNRWSNIFLINFRFVPTMALILVVTVMVGGGFAIGAERALPGDTLYRVKVEFNEEVRGWLATSEEAKANWEVEQVQRRLEEVEKMASRGSFDIETGKDIEANFQIHIDKVKDRIEKFENKENFKAAVDVSAKFETSLRAHRKILDRLAEESQGKNNKKIESIKIKVKSEADNQTKERQRMERRDDD